MFDTQLLLGKEEKGLRGLFAPRLRDNPAKSLDLNMLRGFSGPSLEY